MQIFCKYANAIYLVTAIERLKYEEGKKSGGGKCLFLSLSGSIRDGGGGEPSCTS